MEAGGLAAVVTAGKVMAGSEGAVLVGGRVAARSGISVGAGASVGSGVSDGAGVSLASRVRVGVGDTSFVEQAERVSRLIMTPTQPKNLTGLCIFFSIRS